MKFRALLISIVFAVPIAVAQTVDRPKAVLFDEPGEISRKEIKERTVKFRDEIVRQLKSKNRFGAAIFFYHGENEASSDRLQQIVGETLYLDCRDCMGNEPPRIAFVRGGKAKKQKIQFWIIPDGADDPKP